MRGVRRPRRACGILAVLLVLVAGIHLLQGPAEDMGVGDALHALLQGLGLASGASETHVDIMVAVRLPRLLLAVTAGASLSLAGAVMQAVFRNPLASPEVIGTSSGAALGGVLAIVFGLSTLSPHAVPIVSFGVAAAVTFSVFLFAGSGSRFSVTSLLLAGIAVNTLVGSLISFVTTFSFRNFSESQGVLFWLMGGLDGADYSKILTTAVGLTVCGSLLIPFVRDLDLLTLEDDSARSLGVDVARVRQGLLLVACGLTAVTVANTGGITFVCEGELECLEISGVEEGAERRRDGAVAAKHVQIRRPHPGKLSLPC